MKTKDNFQPRARGRRMLCNGYKIVFNDYWKEFQVSHDEIGFCCGFRKGSKEEAIDYCKRG